MRIVREPIWVFRISIRYTRTCTSILYIYTRIIYYTSICVINLLSLLVSFIHFFFRRATTRRRQNRAKAFESDLERYRRETNEFQNYRDAGELSKYLRKAQNLSKILVAAEQRIRQFNEEEEAFGWTKSTYPHRDRVSRHFCNYSYVAHSTSPPFPPRGETRKSAQFAKDFTRVTRRYTKCTSRYSYTSRIRLRVQSVYVSIRLVCVDI